MKRFDEEMSEFEQELAQAMRHVDAPQGFADRVMERAEQPRAKVLTMPRRVQAWAGGAIAAALLLGAFGVREQHERRERAEEAAYAQQQYELAIQITGETLANVRAQMRQAGVPAGD